MLFVCDIGNSKIKSAFFKDDKISGIKIFDDADSLIKFISGKKISAAAFSSVVPEKLKYLTELFFCCFGFKPVTITKDSRFNLKIDYHTPGTLGTDRICSAEGAFYLFNLKNVYNKNSVIISIDSGTATTINIINYSGIFAGGLILPGINMMFKSLKNETSQLPLVKASEYKSLIGNSTKSSIASGVINATTGAVQRTIDYIKQKNSKSRLKIFITGGNAKFILPYLRFDYVYEQGLVLYGIKAIYDNIVKVQ